MYRLKIILFFVMTLVSFLCSCAQGVQPSLTADLTPVLGTGHPQQVATVMPDIFPQTSEPTTSLPVPNVATVSPASSGLKPPDSETPAAGICLETQGDPVSIVLGLGPDGIPLAGRCIKILPAQRIKFINQSNAPSSIMLGEYQINLPVGSELLLDKPSGEYLARGVHFLPMGPEVWVTEAVAAPPLVVAYPNPEIGYKLSLPADWQIDESGMANSIGKEVTFTPPNPEPFIAYLSIGVDARTLDQIITLYSQSVPDATREDMNFNGYPGIKFTYTYQNHAYRSEYYIPDGSQIFLIATDRPNDSVVQSILMTFQFMAPPQSVTYDATMADNGRTFIMNIGDKLRINLDLNYIWSAISISNPVIIAGAQDGYFAFASGSATLSTTGNPECLNPTPSCAIPSLMYSITVIVR